MCARVASAAFESLESRRLLAAGTEIDLVDLPNFGMVTSQYGVTAHPPMMHPSTFGSTIPNIRRTYSGSFNVSSPFLVTGAFTMRVRKEEARGTFASLRGTLDIHTDQYGNLHGDMTYGKIRDNDRINMTFVGASPAFTAVITGKSNTTGSQLKGAITITGSVNFSTTFVWNKVVITG